MTDLAFAYAGRMFDSDTSLQNNLHRWYDPHSGRWISEDPIGFAVGDANLYRYVGNRVTTAPDPSGLYDDPLNNTSAPPKAFLERAVITNVLRTLHDDHMGTFYFEASGFHKFIATLGKAVNHIKLFEWRVTDDETLKGAYHAKTDAWRFVVLNGNRLTTSPSTTVHEMVHVVDDMNGWYLPAGNGWSSRSAEGLGYAAETLLGFLPALKSFDGDQRGAVDGEGIIWGNDGVEMQKRWDNLWNRFGPSAYSTDVTYNTTWGGIDSEKLAPKDVHDLNAKFGFALSATTLTAEANRILEQRRCNYRLKVPKGVADGFK